ncbi:MAG: DNA alkylation repair protein [Bacteroidota bacterium]
MHIKSIVDEITVTLTELSDPKRKEKSKTYFPTAQEVLGVTNPHIKTLLKELKELHASWTPKQWIELCKTLVAKDIFECQVLAYELIGRDRKLLNSLSYADLEALWRNLDNWASVDHFTVGIYGVLWGKGVVKDEHIDALLKSDNFWNRRIAVVSTVALNLKSRGGTGDTPRTLAVCAKVVDDHHDMIQKALSWALRELSKRDRNAVGEFLERNNSHLAKRVIREVTHKLDFGTKN